jgi:hypothetical protein
MRFHRCQESKTLLLCLWVNLEVIIRPLHKLFCVETIYEEKIGQGPIWSEQTVDECRGEHLDNDEVLSEDTNETTVNVQGPRAPGPAHSPAFAHF